MAKVRVDFKYVNTAIDVLTSDIDDLRGKAANPATRAELEMLYRKLTAIKTLMVGECPYVFFRNFDVVEPAVPKRAKKVAKAKGALRVVAAA